MKNVYLKLKWPGVFLGLLKLKIIELSDKTLVLKYFGVIFFFC